MGRPRAPVDDAAIVGAYLAGTPARTIGRTLGINKETVRRRLIEAGIHKRKPKYVEPSKEDIVALYQKGYGWKRMAKELGTSMWVIRRVVYKYNLPHYPRKTEIYGPLQPHPLYYRICQLRKEGYLWKQIAYMVGNSNAKGIHSNPIGRMRCRPARNTVTTKAASTRSSDIDMPMAMTG